MSHFSIHTRCECQASLSADLDAQRHVLRGFATRHGIREPAPAHSMNADQPRFDVGWLCPYCGRNTMRAFDEGALSKAPAPASGG